MAYEEHFQQTSEAKYDCLLFDIDDTLYPLSSGLAMEVKKNIQEYMVQKLGIEEDKVQELCLSLYKIYGTTMAGLKAVGYDFDYDDFHRFVHGRLPYSTLKPDPILRNIILSLPIRKVFTNADKAHAAKIIARLGLEGCFEKIISFETLNPITKTESPVDTKTREIFDIISYMANPDSSIELPKTSVVCKPSEGAFEQVFKMANINPKKTLFFDDSIRNIQTGKRVGLHTVWVGTSHREEGVDIALEHIHNIREALPQLWDAVDDKAKEIRTRQKVAIETIA
ncbi:Haloacid dehalogenase-like hydrolase (HAD) superfamily protein [Arabidopsis thaliana]|uniref:Haloacid dehalogenase-like hydrolase (HAD) superfamily protein n=1 Tax=Arabidopsis thaliana TaxID=3702 RepID=F4KJ69_ARATH|nr:Haloacid dehalogenase-like hydrolase (HAD) superfamily protein [Arabidopsis thaliana]AED97196.1 Haloacid dehalogenase-like hydrolase (HAD) superfamily protein [Arabidopsis thaliana]|eukprot:NP_200756.2 Haloacid dehalogenase-like hydrolase (HAD) superfamily protein [Arabidopsis thaliana]